MSENPAIEESAIEESAIEESAVEEALRLAAEIKQREVKLEALKVSLREQAARIKSGERHSFFGRLGKIVVSFQKDRVSTLGDMPALKASIGDDLFSLLFKEEITYAPRPEILSLIHNLTPQIKTQVENHLQQKKETPRVSFYPGVL